MAKTNYVCQILVKSVYIFTLPGQPLKVFHTINICIFGKNMQQLKIYITFSVFIAILCSPRTKFKTIINFLIFDGSLSAKKESLSLETMQ